MTTTAEKIRDHLTQQKAKSGQELVNGSYACYYRHPSGDGRMCAVGCLISDEEYTQDMELLGVSGLMDPYVTLHRGFKPWTPPEDITRTDLGKWQQYHDGNTEVIIDTPEQRQFRRFDYGQWCQTGDPEQSPEALYQALKENEQ